ncbi:ABC transporter permease [Lactobacillus delbrueckii]|uniref:ABC transporter permease n=1 Tax=Lactobacillus delbrueckii TaxID=1584 RepID=UPI003A839B03
MFLALKEIKHEKMRYGLIVFMIFLIAYMILATWGLAYGLARENTVALEGWQTKSVVLNKNANLFMNSSILTKDDLKKIDLTDKEAVVGELQVVAKKKGKTGINAQYMGVKKGEFIYKDQDVIAGRRAKSKYEVTADSSFKDKGYKLGDKVTLNGSDHKYTIVGFVKDAKINIEPIMCGFLPAWKELKNVAPGIEASGIISQRKLSVKGKNFKAYGIKEFTEKLPGHSEQNLTFELMIAFMFIISLAIVAVFLYILTIQKLPNYAVLRAQGVPAKTLIWATVSQSLLLVTSALVLALLAIWGTAAAIPASVPMAFTPGIFVATIGGMLVMGLLGGLNPVRTILKIDPVQAIGG